MARFSVSLIEQNVTHLFSLDSRGNREYLLRSRSGMLRRKYNGGWQSSALELSHPRDAVSLVPGGAGLKLDDWPGENPAVDPAKIVRKHRELLNLLDDLSLAEWKLVFRSRMIQRCVLTEGGNPRFPAFSHYSILIRCRQRPHDRILELGEGNTGGFHFNQSGLGIRLSEVLKNHRDARPVAFPDKVPVILHSGDGAIVFHEILGHSLEADYVYQNMSCITPEDIDRRIASSGVTISVHDQQDRFFGEVVCDDEGFRADSPVLVEDGVLRGLIADFFYTRLLGLPGKGHSRLEDFTRIPMPRMFALYLQPGTSSAEEVIASTKFGLFAREFGDGTIYFHRGLFHFEIKEAYLVENGRITAPLGRMVVSGNIRETLNSIEMVAEDFRLDKGISYCIKNGQSVNVRVGQPTVKVNNLMVTRGFSD